jgi:polysaccharide deacetylase family protein (PEP-CTERM system associated)
LSAAQHPSATLVDLPSRVRQSAAAAALPFEIGDAHAVRPLDPGAPRNAFTVDVEDWYQSCLDYDAPITDRVVRNVDRILTVLDECGIKGTFFVQGRVAEAFPRLVASLVEQGHEVQSHGYSHRPLFSMSRDELRDELERAKKTVEDCSGTAVTAFRAQDFSIVSTNLWAFELLAEVGFEVDSSIFAMKSRRYGIAQWRLGPHYLVTGGARILEVPVAVWSVGRLRFPVAGGGYFRVLPRRVVERGLRSIDAADRPAIVYCHPYEFNAHEFAGYDDIPARVRAWQGLGRGSFTERIRTLLPKFAFGRLDAVLAAWSLR